MIEESIYTLLSTVGVVSPSVMAQTQESPYMVYTVISNLPSTNKAGVSRLDVMRLQINIYSTSAKSSAALFESLRTAIDGYSGGNIQHIIYDSHRDLYDERAEFYGRSADFMVRIKR